MLPVKPLRTDVFISSTYDDLIDYRTAVTEAILALGLFPSGMENWPLRDENAIELCQRKIDEAEVFVGIYAYRYGWTPDGYDGKSITELEYDWATERKIPRLRFIMADTQPWPEKFKEKDAQPALNAFKNRLKQEVVGFFSTPDDLKAQVIAALAPYAAQSSTALLTPYLRAMHTGSRQSGLLRALDPRTNDPAYGGRSVTVDQVYVPLNTNQSAWRDEYGNIGAMAPGYAHMEETSSGTKLQHSRLSLMDVAAANERLVILGDPGSGKSTFVNFLTMALTGVLLDEPDDWAGRLAAQGWTHGLRYPVVVILRDFAQSINPDEAPSYRTLWDFIEREVVGKAAPDSAPALRGLAERGQILYLLDGLDEVPSERRGRVRDAIEKFAEGCPANARFIITCRILSYADPVYRVPGFDDHTIAPLDEDQIAAFIRAWYAALIALGTITEATAEDRVNDLTAVINRQGLTELASNPMLLTVMTLVHNHLGTLPREMARLYHECVDLLLLKWHPHDARALIELLGIREDDLLRLVWEIAFDAHDQQAEREGTADIQQHAVEMIARKFLNNDAAKGQAFCDYIEKRAGLLIGRGFDRYGGRIYTFPHRTFQEFLAGCHLSVNRFARAAADYARRGTPWREALLLATGNLVFNHRNVDTPVDAVSRILEEAAPQTSDNHWRMVVLAGDMLNLVGLDNLARDRYGERALNDARAALVQVIEGSHLNPVERAAAGRTLSVLGDPRPGVGLLPSPVSEANAGEGLGVRPPVPPLQPSAARERGLGGEVPGLGVRRLPDIRWADPIPAGTYWIGADDQSDNPRRQITIAQPFRMAKYLVTQAQYLAFQNDTSEHGYTCAEWWLGLAATDKEKRPAQPYFPYANHPMENVNWYQAVAFSKWLTWHYREAGLIAPEEEIRLPHEHEWEVAARGAEERVYSYRGEFDATKCNAGDTGIGQTSAVGLFPDGESPCRALDMTGNVWEWCLNRYKDGSSDLDGTNVRVLRGGSWVNLNSDIFRCEYRDGYVPHYWLNFIGFRLALS
jgi:formylglycine-generating enzyme required for sulfatase activity